MKKEVEWNGHIIVFKNTSFRAELSVDGRTQDYFGELIVPKNGVELKAKTNEGDSVVAKIERALVGLGQKCTIYYNGREIENFVFFF